MIITKELLDVMTGLYAHTTKAPAGREWDLGKVEAMGFTHADAAWIVHTQAIFGDLLKDMRSMLQTLSELDNPHVENPETGLGPKEFVPHDTKQDYEVNYEKLKAAIGEQAKVKRGPGRPKKVDVNLVEQS